MPVGMFMTGVSWFQVNAAIWKPRIVSVTRKVAIANQMRRRTKRRSRAGSQSWSVSTATCRPSRRASPAPR